VYRVGTWGTICGDGWGLNDAQVVCRHLGYAGAKVVHQKSYFGEGREPIWLDDLACYGNETNLGQCSHNGWGNHDCTHAKDAGVVCDKGNKNGRLFNGWGGGRGSNYLAKIVRFTMRLPRPPDKMIYKCNE